MPADPYQAWFDQVNYELSWKSLVAPYEFPPWPTMPFPALEGLASGTPTAQPRPVSPAFDPQIQANALYGKPMALFSGGYARIGAPGAPIVGPFIHDDVVDFVVSFGVPANPDGDRKIFNIWLDQELAWTSVTGGTLPGDGTFTNEPFDFIFKPGRLDQTVCSLETMKYPGDENAYRPQMLLQILNIPYARFVEKTEKPVPYVACDIGDVTDGADPADGINLGEALERIAYSPWAGYTTGTFESTGITDVIRSILIKDNFTVIQLCQSVTQEYRNIDLVLSDKLRIKDRGSNVAPDFVFDRNSIISGGDAVSVVRGDATAQRREHELIAIDPDQDYTAVSSLSKIPRDPMVISAAVGKATTTVPLVIDASTRQALATFSQYYDENARRRVTLKVLASGYEIEPGDLFALTDIADGFDAEVFKCVATTHGANWVVAIEGAAILRCSIYGFSLVAFDPATIALVTLSGGDLVVTNTGGASTEQGARVAATYGKETGNYYFEMTPTVGGIGGRRCFGIGPPTSNFSALGDGAGALIYHANGQIWASGVNTGITFGVVPEGWVVRIAVDLDNRKIWFSLLDPVGGTAGYWNNSPTANPATNVGGVTVPAGVMVPFCAFGGSSGTSGQVCTANFGGSIFAASVPAGFIPGWPS